MNLVTLSYAQYFGLFMILSVVIYLLGKVAPSIRSVLSFLSLLLAAFLFTLLQTTGQTTLLLLNFTFGIDILTKFFVWMTFGIAIIVSFVLVSNRELSPTFHALYLINVIATVFIFLSRDLISFFLAWELMGWTTFAMIISDGWTDKLKAARKYFVWSAIGAYFVLIGFAILISQTGYYQFEPILAHIGTIPTGWLIFAVALLVAGFGVKAAMMPLHVWAPDAYSESPHEFTGFFSGVLSKAGVYGVFMAFFYFAARFEAFNMLRIHGTSIFGYIMVWIGAITAFGAALIATNQEYGKKLLAWSSVSQLGYIIFAFGIADSLGMTGALAHALAHALFKSLLFIIMAAVIMRTGTDHLPSLGGLIKKMPLSFIFAVVGGLALAGIPMTIGFTSKWIIYEAGIHGGYIFTTTLIFAASTAAFLYYYRFVYSVFLGPLHEEHKEVKEAPAYYWISYIVIAIPIFYFGLYPGKLVAIISKILDTYDLPSLQTYTATTVTTPLGTFNGLLIGLGFGAALLVGIILYLIGGRTKKAASPTDKYLASEVVTNEFELHYATDFYKFLERELHGILKISAQKFYAFFEEIVRFTADLNRKMFFCGNGQAYLYYLTILLTILIFAIWRINL